MALPNLSMGFVHDNSGKELLFDGFKFVFLVCFEPFFYSGLILGVMGILGK